jgi:hypothetical protein
MYINHRLITPYHPRGNGVAENHVKSSCNMIRKMVQDRSHHWDRHVPFIQLAMNTRTVHLHNSSPFSLFFARQANGFSNYTNDEGQPLSQDEMLERLKYMTETVFPAVAEKAKATQAKMIARFNATVLHNEYPDGAKVMTLDPLKGDKLTPRYEGPYTVVQRTSTGAYTLKDGTGEILGRNYAPSQLKLVLDDFDDTETYEVEAIVDHRPSRVTPHVTEYFVKWKGFSSDKNTWEPEEHFIERRCIADYWADHHAKYALPTALPTALPSKRKRTARVMKSRKISKH